MYLGPILGGIFGAAVGFVILFFVIRAAVAQALWQHQDRRDARSAASSVQRD